VRKRIPKHLGRRLDPKILIFDVDGVLVDVRETYWRSGLETIRHLTGKRPTWAEFHQWKRMPGNNDDWRMVSRWATALGVPTSYDEARIAFAPFYWGHDGQPGNVEKEKLLVTPKLIARWAKGRELNLFTGRTRQEFTWTFDKWPAVRAFRTIITQANALPVLSGRGKTLFDSKGYATHKVTEQYRSLAAEVEERVVNRRPFLLRGREGPQSTANEGTEPNRAILNR